MSFELPKLNYAYDALEPTIDAKTMEIHYTGHHQAYVDNLNKAIAGTDLDALSIEEICKTAVEKPAVRNNGGGHFNHTLFWEILTPGGANQPTAEVADAINAAFGSFEAFKDEFSKAAATRFGSGWAWLCVHKGGKLDVCGTPNQDNPLMPEVGCGGTPILGMDVWEHAYYLNYQNRRPDYIEAFFNVINWTEVARRFALDK